ncbi:L,D-transpeptidase [Bacilliculturomica massiliensis]|uniref:L,D-transpeptidase n=1 Tax=Bacilliculturomica massiliensis TaxID=1917867 RepID=UPI0013EF0247|nr:L,D-transpeptidase [Bacilliculturomica massiliensis]
MKNRTLLTLVLFLTAVMLFFVILHGGRDTLLQRENVLTASAGFPATEMGETIAAVDDEIMDPKTPIQLKYSRYPITYVYFVVDEESIPVYSSPNNDKRVVRQAAQMEKLSYVETVTLEQDGGQEVWYHVFWYENGGGEVLPDGSAEAAEKRFGFIPEGSAEKRRLRVDLMAEYVKKAETFASGGGITHISNYKNGHGRPPQYRGGDQDALGNQRSQSAPGYADPTDKSEFVYLADGTLVRVLEPAVGADGRPVSGGEDPQFRKVLSANDGKTYYVPLAYLPDTEALTELKKVVVIDRNNQNEAAFEKVGGAGPADGTGLEGEAAPMDENGPADGWVCVSHTLATTGKSSQYAVPTPLGFYMMMEKRPQFYYYKDGTTQIQGYAPYVLRFCGGAYIHGVPVSYEYKNGKRITPPIKEFSPTMGTVPLSHKCVRNYTSHAEFLSSWYEPGKTAVIVIE